MEERSLKYKIHYTTGFIVVVLSLLILLGFALGQVVADMRPLMIVDVLIGFAYIFSE